MRIQTAFDFCPPDSTCACATVLPSSAYGTMAVSFSGALDKISAGQLSNQPSNNSRASEPNPAPATVMTSPDETATFNWLAELASPSSRTAGIPERSYLATNASVPELVLPQKIGLPFGSRARPVT